MLLSSSSDQEIPQFRRRQCLYLSVVEHSTPGMKEIPFCLAFWKTSMASTALLIYS
ncbi:hypothetical protein [Desulfobacter curvatus]|uniref:hypothetical protein n=1 Tax=Desulfobacter curvatus TaxID=2290 RepID=UPI00146B0A7B|nr:hypothetical protein [Desulfobacter curvatus]